MDPISCTSCLVIMTSVVAGKSAGPFRVTEGQKWILTKREITKLWEQASSEEKMAWHNINCLNCKKFVDMELAIRFMERVQLVLDSINQS